MNQWDLLETFGAIDDKYIEEAATAQKKRLSFPGTARIFAIAACLVLFLGLGTVSLLHHLTGGNTIDQIPTTAMGAPTPGGRKILHFGGYRYAFLGDGAQYDLSGMKLTNELGTLRDGAFDPAAAGQDMTATFAVGGTLYELPTYSKDFRIAVSYEGATYIAQLVGRTDNTPLDVGYYLDASALAKRTEKAVIHDHMGMASLRELSKADALHILDCLQDAQIAGLDDAGFSAIASAQSEGESFLLSFLLSDGTAVEMYVIPTLRFISVGDDFYQLPERFRSTCAKLFDGLEQGPLPLR